MDRGPWRATVYGARRIRQLKQLSMRVHTHTHTHTHDGTGILALRAPGGAQCSVVRIALHGLSAESPVSTEYRAGNRELEIATSIRVASIWSQVKRGALSPAAVTEVK